MPAAVDSHESSPMRRSVSAPRRRSRSAVAGSPTRISTQPAIWVSGPASQTVNATSCRMLRARATRSRASSRRPRIASSLANWQPKRCTSPSSDHPRDRPRSSCCSSVWPLRVGALIGSAGTAPLAAMTRFGFYLGAAFQIRDDLLNLVGSEARYGKELLGDIREGKRTLMLIHLLGSVRADERERLVA